ncbi:MAG TPA: S8 family serine peptidase [Acidimicrobiales bacterium]|nr:S8 family serine peptidase [Acidimicrobiales bacterium]
MKASVARRCALALVAALVAALMAPHLAQATTAPAKAQPSPSPHDAMWSRRPFDMRTAKRAFQGKSSSSSSSAVRGYEGTNAPNPCYYSIWSDPANDAPELDATSYGALYDCPTGKWTFTVSTRDSWGPSELDVYAIALETDNNFNDGCNGIDYVLEGDYFQGTLEAALVRTPDCTQGDWFVASTAGITRASNSQIALAIPNSALGTPAPTSIRWAGSISGISEQGQDYIPDADSGGLQPLHYEDGFTGSACTVGVDSLHSSYAVVDNPQAAAAALQADGQPGATASGSGSGVVHFSGDPARAGATLARAGIKANVSPDLLRHYAATPNDPAFGQQWSLNAVNAPAAWDVTKGSPAVVVADLDSGVDPTHPDLQGKLVAGYDVLTSQPLSTTTNSDNVGHGTATAGIIGAATDNANQVASLGWLTSVMPVKIGDQNGALSSNTALGIRWATDHGAKVLNLSIGSPCIDGNEQAAVQYAQSHGVLLVASGGNEAQDGDRPDYPAAYPGVLAVAATDSANVPTSYSNYGSYIDIAAPGGSADGTAAHDIVVLAPGGGLAVGAGTSFSAPLVAATSGLLQAVNPNLTAASTRSLLMDTATDIWTPGRDGRTGAGLLNAALAVQTAALRAKFNPLPPARILDTRNGTGGAPTAPLGPNQTRTVKVTGVGNVPASGASAVILNVTAVGGTAGSFLTVYPSDVGRPLASNLNFPPGATIPNLVVVKVGGDGNVAVYNAQGNVDVIFDVVGWYGQTGDSYNALSPARILDTRDGTGGPGGRLGPNQSRPVTVAGMGGVPASGATAVVLNVTAVAPSDGSYLTLYPSDVAQPLASNLNFGPGQNIPNLVVVKVGSDGKVDVYNAQGTVDVIFDVVGWYGATGSTYGPLPPHRVVDTRDGTGTLQAPMAAGESRTIKIAGAGGVPGSGVSGVVINVTAVSPSAGSYLTVYPAGVSRPVASNLNFGPGQIIPNLVFVKLSSDGSVALYNDQGHVDVIFDVVGWFT